MRFVFRVAASPDVGLGHIVRCRALAQELTKRGATCFMLGPSRRYIEANDERIFSDWTEIGLWAGEIEDARRLARMARSVAAERVVLDDYRIRLQYQQELLAGDAPPWLQMAPMVGEKIHARWIYNANPSAAEMTYRATAQHPQATYLIGPQYAILRPEFRSPLPHRSADGPPRVLLSFGGGDDRGSTIFALSALSPLLADVHIDVLCGAANPNIPEIEAWIRRRTVGNVDLFVAPAEVVPLFHRADLGVFASGTTGFEAAACGLPMVLIPISENQVQQSRAWQELGVATALDQLGVATEAKLRQAVQRLLEDPGLRLQRAELGRGLVDGHGAARVAKALCEPGLLPGRPLTGNGENPLTGE
jgi:UDP-2,4-diacetamido-2,4,6-trideoxy-beta-L-altropyranose hydrolase